MATNAQPLSLSPSLPLSLPSSRPVSLSSDLVFTGANNGRPLSFYLDPFPGCNSPDTLFWVAVPASAFREEGDDGADIEMYYGNPLMVESLSDPSIPGLFAFYEGFEDLSGSLGRFKPFPHCGASEPNPSAFRTSTEFPYAGKGALHAQWGQAGVVQALLEQKLENFVFRAWFYDSDAESSAQYISPNFNGCPATREQQKPQLPDVLSPPHSMRSTAVGVYTPSVVAQYAMASPWRSTGMGRTASWHLLEVSSSAPGGTRVFVDGIQVHNDSRPSAADRVWINAGFGNEDENEDWTPVVLRSHAFWDEIIVAVADPGINPVAAPRLTDHSDWLSWAPDRTWKRVAAPAGSSSPAPRQGHSSVTFKGIMYVFGGERSAYHYNDLWAFDLEKLTWTYLPARLGEAPPPRFEHGAGITSEGTLLIFGGRGVNRTVFGDLWGYTTTANARSWVGPLPIYGDAPAPRFGHSATVVGDSLFVFGGYTEEGSLSSELFQISVHTGQSRRVPTPGGLEARYAHCAVAKDAALYIFGGSNSRRSFGDLWKYDTVEGKWLGTKMAPEDLSSSFGVAADVPVWRSDETHTDKSQGTQPEMGLYKHTCGVMPGGMFVQGGHGNGQYQDSTWFYPL